MGHYMSLALRQGSWKSLHQLDWDCLSLCKATVLKALTHSEDARYLHLSFDTPTDSVHSILSSLLDKP